MKKQLIIAVCCLACLSQARAQAPAPAAGTAAPATTEATTDESAYNFADTDIALALTTLARRAGVSLIIGDGVMGKVTVHLEGVAPKDAMRLIAESKGFVFQEEKNIVNIRTKEAAENVPLEMRVFTLKYAKAEEMQKLFTEIKGARGKVQVDIRSNTLVLSDTRPNLDKIMPILEALDTQTPQVMIEAKFIETTKNPKKDLGINWSGTTLNHSFKVGGVPSATSGGGSSGSQATIGPYLNSLVSWTAPGLMDVGQASIVFSFLSQDTESELLANPRVVTADNGKAKINITQQFPIPSFTFSEQTASFQINGFQYKDIGIILNVSPHINKDNFVTLEVTPEVSSSSTSVKFTSGNSASFDIPVIDIRQASTTVLIKSGYTLAMGGLIRQDVSDSYTKVPVMGDIPGLGALFRSKSLSKTKRNLLVFLTPTIVKPDVENPTGLEKFSNGLQSEDVYTNDKWMPKDNAKPRDLLQPKQTTPDKSIRKPTQNFSHKSQ